jgi:hypothetical protein
VAMLDADRTSSGEDTMTTRTDESVEAMVNRNALWAGAGLIGLGALMVAAGALISGAAAVAAVRRWADHLEEPPSQLARRRLSQARAATSAGLEAWRNQNQPTAATGAR